MVRKIAFLLALTLVFSFSNSFLLAQNNPGQGQDADSSDTQMDVQLDSVIVTASRIPTTVSESGKSVSVITQQEIQQMPVTSVDDLLRTLPGVNINSRQGFGVQSDVGVRGSTFSQVLFMLDNVPLNDPLTAHFNTNIPVSLSEIGRIEFVRGPASASFGADAVGGVVHIKTRSYLRRQIEGDDKLQSRITADIAGGQHDLKMGSAGVDLHRNRWRFTTSVQGIMSDGEKLDNPVFDDGISDEPTYNNYFELANITSSLTYQFSDHITVYARGGMDERDFSARYFYTRNQFDQSEEQISSKWGLAAVTFEKNQHHSEINFSYRNVEDTFDFWPGTLPPNVHTTEQLYVNASHQYELPESTTPSQFNYIRVMAGGQAHSEWIESTDRGDHSTDMGGLYAIGSLSWKSGWNVTASARVQFDEIAETEFLPQLSASYQMEKVTLRGSAGKAIRVGDFTERYISSQIDNLSPGRNIGNPDLRPERSWTVDAGFDWRPLNTIKISPTVFYRTSEDLIDFALVNSNNITNADNLQPDELYFYTSNIAQSSVLGAELFTSFRQNLGNGKTLSLEPGYTYINTTSDGDAPSKYIANHPEHKADLGIGFSIGWASIASENSYIVRSKESESLIEAKVPSAYFISNLNIQVKPDWSPATAYVRVMNLTDTKYQEILGAPMPRRWVMAGLKVEL